MSALALAQERSVTAVLGPPGSGKTTLVTAWIRAGLAPGPAAWLFLDAGDNSPRYFWRHLLEALRQQLPDIQPPPRGSPTGWVAARHIATRLSTRRVPLVLVLDEVDVLTEPTIGRDLDRLLTYSRSGLHLVVCGSGGSVAWLHRRRVAGDLTQIGPEDLTLAADEVPGILDAHGVRLDAAGAAALHRCTEGWMTGLCLHALALRQEPAFGALPSPRGRQAVADFLRAEVLAAQPARVRDFLLRTSVLERVDPELADRLTGRCDARGILEQLAHAGGFVAYADDGGFRYREPFRTVLVDALVGGHPDLAQRMHLGAARWYAERHLPQAAVVHAVRAGDWPLAATVAAEQLGVASLLADPATQFVRDLFAELPEGLSSAAVELVRCALALRTYDVGRAAATLARVRAAAGTRRSNDVDLAALVLARLTGDFGAAEAAAQSAVSAAGVADLPAAGDSMAHSLVLSNLGVAQLGAGRIAEARATLERAAMPNGPGAAFGAHDALGHLGLLCMYQGRLQEAESFAQEAIAVADRAGVPPRCRIGAASATLAACGLVRNDFAVARRHAADAIATFGSQNDPLTAATLCLVRAWAACARQDGERVIAATEAARAYLPSAGAAALITDRIELTALRGYLLTGELGAAGHCVDRIRDQAERTVARGYLLEAKGDHAAARELLTSVATHEASPSALQYAALALGRLAAADGDVNAATTALGDALDYGRPGLRRRAVSDAGKWAPPLLRENRVMAAKHDWLTAPASGDSAGDGGIAQPLTDREAQVLRYLAEALAIRDIAATMDVSVNTVKTHLKNIYRKLGTTGRSAAARRARELALLPDAADGFAATHAASPITGEQRNSTRLTR